MEKVLVATRMGARTHQALKQLARTEERTVSFLLRKAAEEYVDIRSVRDPTAEAEPRASREG